MPASQYSLGLLSYLRSSAFIGGFIHLCTLCAFCGSLSLSLRTAAASDLDEFKVKREAVFEFAEKPQVTRAGDRVTIRFATKGYCDVTVAIEDGEGRTLRHLASGVLGPNAPGPFQKDSKVQTLIWDGKDDDGAYVDRTDEVRVRVSLGLRPRFERTLFWSPKKRTGREPLPIAAAEEGVYVYDGRNLDHLRLFDHQGTYLRTIYPFPAGQLERAQGLHLHTFPQDGARLPLKEGFHQATLLNAGTNSGFDGIGVDRWNNWHGSVWGSAACTMAVRNGRIALARMYLNRLATDGSTGGLPLLGPRTAFPIKDQGAIYRGQTVLVPPRSAALSPDGRRLYLTGYLYGHGVRASRDIVLIQVWGCLHGVAVLDVAGDAEPQVFAGSMDPSDWGNDDEHFAVPISVDCDAAGRVYVADYFNDRLQVFSPEGSCLRTIETERPARVVVDRRTGEICVFSWPVPDALAGRRPRNRDATVRVRSRDREEAPRVILTRLGALDNPRVLASYVLPLSGSLAGMYRGAGVLFSADVDSWTDPPTVWLAREWGTEDVLNRGRVAKTNVLLFALEPDGKVRLLRDFTDDVRREVVRIEAAEYARQRLYVNPRTGLCYVGEGQAASGKSFRQLVRLDPETGAVGLVDLPFDAEDMCFGPDGLAYLRTFYLVARYHPETWREVPWDYGESQRALGTSSSRDGRRAEVTSAIRLPVAEAGLHHHGGMAISPRGHLVVAVNNYTETPTRRDLDDQITQDIGKPYTPPIFPGRVRWGEIHVWDRHGRALTMDAIPGINRLDGIGIDRDDNLYVMATATRLLDGQPYFNDMTETLVKFRPAKGKVVSPSDRASVPLTKEAAPERLPDLMNGHVARAWAEGAEWFYGGLGFAGKNAARAGGGCDCHNARFVLDDFARSFAPEVDHYSVAVLDSGGNLITRVGRYGNVDDGIALVSAGGPPNARSIGGDEVSLFHAAYLGVHTDHRLFIADAGNGRILSVRLDYHATAQVPLKGVPDAGQPGFTAKDAKNAKNEED